MLSVTTLELAAAAGCTAETILEWRRLGLFDGIESSKTGGGKSAGVRRLWAPEALTRVAELKQLRRQGWNMTMLKTKFAQKKGRRPKGTPAPT